MIRDFDNTGWWLTRVVKSPVGGSGVTMYYHATSTGQDEPGAKPYRYFYSNPDNLGGTPLPLPEAVRYVDMHSNFQELA